MPQRLKELLDGAVAEIEPRTADPVRAVVRRGRAARARAVAAGGLALVAVLTGGTVAGARLFDDGPRNQETGAAPAATRPEQPPTPRLENGRIVAGDVSVAVPRGWRVLPLGTTATTSPDDQSGQCGPHRDTVMFGEGGNPWGPSIYCSTAGIEVLSTFDVFPFVWEPTGKDATAPDGWRRTPTVPYRMLTLDGGAPAWLRTDSDGAYRIVLPWSRVEVTVRGGAQVRRQVLASLKTGRWETDALALPEATEYAALTVPTGADRAREVRLTDRAKIQRAVELLRGAVAVEPGDSCARTDQPSVALEIGKAPDLPNTETGSFLIGLASRCHEVVAEEGGRARLDDASLAELGDLFGVGLP